MLKITAVISLLFIVSSVWAAGLSCDSCGSECSPACGTRRFRACCFNYLRRKRGPEALKIQSLTQDVKETQPSKLSPFEENISKSTGWNDNEITRENQLYYLDDTIENHLYYV